MKYLAVIFFLSSIIFFISCTSLKNLSAKNNSSTQSSSNKNHDLKFLNGVSVAGSLKKTSYYSYKNQKVIYAPPPFIVTKVNIEKLNVLQIKYAIILDATVEQLTNTPLFETIDHWWGTPYCYGGNSEKCIDCSAFSQTLMHTVFGINVPRTAQEQFNNSKRINAEDLKEGDLVFFHTSGGDVTHVGVYLLNNKFVHAASSSGVMVSDLNDDYWRTHFVGAGRVR